ncbi:hypothetical protein B0H19DRAFT_908117, partial [Mycena capillaripes]
NEDDFYGAADTLISKDKPVLHVANFSKMPVVISPGQVVGTARNPRTWLDKMNKYSKEQQQKINAHAHLIRTLAVPVKRDSSITTTVRSETKIASKAQKNETEPDDPLAEEPLEGGPKTAEAPGDPGGFPDEIDISPGVTAEQRKKLEEVVRRNSSAFGLDGRLGSYETKVEIPMKPGADPVSLPPFPVSPANREVI